MEKVILTTGGTGGHIFPALAVAEELRKRNPDIKLLFLGSLYGPEADLAGKAAIPFAGLNVHGFLGRGLRAVPATWQMFKAIFQAGDAIRKFDPQVVAGFGGYASFAPMLAASLLRKPVLLHEQNAIAGTGNRVLAKLARKICVSLPHTRGFSGPVVVTGNPVRRGIGTAYRGGIKEGRHLLVLGGSQGAHALNLFIRDILPRLRQAGVEITHQCGEKDLEMLRRAYAENGYSPDCARAFINDMPAVYGSANLAFCRSGASTVAELCAAGLPAVLVPFPAAIHDHQTENARVPVEMGGAVLVPEKDLDRDKTADLIIGLLNDPEKLATMSSAMHALAKIDAAAALVDELENLAAQK